MTRRESSSEIDAVAADWVARLDRQPDDPRVRSELGAWLATDDRRKGAFVRAQAAWRLLDRAQALPYPERATARQRGRFFRRRYFITGAAAAGLTAVGLMRLNVRQAPQRFETRVGEQRIIAMADGSTASLDAATLVEVRFRNELRLVELQKGEAWFKVAKDKSRPFIIDAGSMTARAVGTAFSVGREDGLVRVIVTEGIVEVGSSTSSAAIRLMKGMQATTGSDGRLRVETLTAEAMNRLLAWRDRKIALNGETVRQASEAFNRYNDLKIILDDAELADQRVVGWFNTNDPQGFARALEISFGAKATREGETLRMGRAGK